MYEVDLYRRVRLACHHDGLSRREAARRFGIDRKTIAKMLAFSVPPGYRRSGPPRRPKLDPFTGIIDRILEGDQGSHRKQRHTAKKIFERLRDEYGFTGGYTIVKDYVRGRRRRTREMFVPLAHPPGHAQVDFVENGRGYVAATEQAENLQDQEVGIIPIDAVFSPVTRVRYSIEETRVGQKTNYDKLIVEVQTDGSIGPEMALVEAAKILRKHLTPFVQYTELGPQVHSASRGSSVGGADNALEMKLNMSIAELNLSVRAGNCLETENILQVRDLVCRTEDQLLEVRNFGETTLAEVQLKLRELGLHLGMRVPGPPASV